MGAAPAPRGIDLLALHERFPDRYPALLESVSGAEALGRTDLLFALPGARLVQPPDAPPGFLDALDDWYRAEKTGHSGFPDAAKPGASLFSGGWFLYLGYELAAEIEPTLRLPRAHLPRAVASRRSAGCSRRPRAAAAGVRATNSAP